MASTAMVSMGARRIYSSATSITSRPLYFPQCGQTRCGSLGSWQLGHSDTTALVSESCVRRADVRRLECRLLGFGMVSFLLKFLERRPAVVGSHRLALAPGLIPVPPAHRADSLTTFTAYALHGEREQYKLPQHVVQLDPVLLIEAHFGFAFVDRPFRTEHVGDRLIVQLEIGIDLARCRLQTAIAIRFHAHRQVAFRADLAERTNHQLDLAGSLQSAGLPQFRVEEFDLARTQFDVKTASPNFKIPNMKEHGAPRPTASE